VIETKEETIWKEMQASLDVSWNATLDYDAILSHDPSKRFVRMFPNLPLNPHLHRQLYNAFVVSRKLLTNTVLYPHMSDKTIGRSSRDQASFGILLGQDELLSMREIQSTEDCEKFYHKTGVEFRGVVEVRSAWKYNDLKPRVYYAQGPSCYNASKYIQSVFNTILDLFEVVHRYNRFENPLGRLEHTQDRLATYDYSSFTSSMEEVKRFTRALANFYSGTQVVILDTFRGPSTADLGDLIYRYNEECNETADFDVQHLLDLEHELILRHTTGMLGVPGNISSCTLLHGLHLVVALDDIYLGRCVGDDALAIVRRGADEEIWANFIDRVNNLGKIADEKFEFWDYDHDPEWTGGSFCKRPIKRLENAILREYALIWPGVHDLIPLRDIYHTVRPSTQLSKTKKFIAQWSRLLTRIETFQIELSTAALQILTRFQNTTYTKMGLHKGGVVYIKDFHSRLICPKKLDTDEFGCGWKQITVDFIKRAEVPIEVPCWASTEQELCYTEGETFEGPMTRELRLMVRLGYIGREIQRETIDLRTVTCPEYLERLVTLQYPFQYVYTVLHDCPLWIRVVSSLEHMSPHERFSVTSMLPTVEL